MDDLLAVDLARDTLITALKIVAPALLIGMLVGVLMSLFQAITSVQEQTLSVVPKMLAVAGALLLLLPWILQTLVDFTGSLLSSLHTLSR